MTNKPKRKVSAPQNMIYGKIPPQSIELEKNVLGAILLEPICLSTVLDLIFADVFYSDANKLVFEAIISLYDENKSIDSSTVCQQLQKNETLDLVGGVYYISTLTMIVVSSANIEDHCRFILEKYLSRELIKISMDSLNDAYEDSVDIFNLYSRVDGDLLDTQERAIGGSIKDTSYYSAKVEEQYLAVKQTGVIGIQTRLTEINKRMGGLVEPDLIVLAARPGQGKTAKALSIIYGTSVQDKVPVAVFSLEMDGVQLVRRLASIDSGIDHEDIRRGNVPTNDEIKFYDSLNKIGNSPVYIEDKVGINIRNIRTRLTILKRRYGIRWAVVDYLQLMEAVTPSGSREQDVSSISRGLKNISKELKIPILALSQLSRAVESRSDKMPQLSDLRESGAIEQDADIVIFLMRPEYYGFIEPVEISGKQYPTDGLGITILAKNRHGGVSNFATFFNKKTMHFVNHPLDGNVSTYYKESDDLNGLPF